MPERIYLVERAGEPLGFGVAELATFAPRTAGIGMFVLPEFRGAGVGAGILGAPKERYFAEGLRVVSDCRHCNHRSKRTIERAGGCAKARLLKFSF